MFKYILIIFYYLLFQKSLFATEFYGKFYQGNLIIGKTLPNSTVLIDRVEIKVSKDGNFVFGLDKDRKNDVVVNVVNKNKT